MRRPLPNEREKIGNFVLDSALCKRRIFNSHLHNSLAVEMTQSVLFAF